MKQITAEPSHNTTELVDQQFPTTAMEGLVLATLLQLATLHLGSTAAVGDHSATPSAKLKIVATKYTVNQEVEPLTTAVHNVETMISFRATGTNSMGIY